MHNGLWQANLFKHVSRHRKYRVSEIESMERWRDVFSAGLQDYGVGAGDNKSGFLHDAAVGGPSGEGEGDTVPRLIGGKRWGDADGEQSWLSTERMADERDGSSMIDRYVSTVFQSWPRMVSKLESLCAILRSRFIRSAHLSYLVAVEPSMTASALRLNSL